MRAPRERPAGAQAGRSRRSSRPRSGGTGQIPSGGHRRGPGAGPGCTALARSALRRTGGPGGPHGPVGQRGRPAAPRPGAEAGRSADAVPHAVRFPSGTPAGAGAGGAARTAG
ncbi:hypothetical protein GCM10027440_17570 [Nocardiopsis coralliicola]